MAKFNGKWVNVDSLKAIYVLSWSGSGPYTMDIAQSEHKRGLHPMVQVLSSTGGIASNSTWDYDVQESTGNITIRASENFSGTVVIL